MYYLASMEIDLMRVLPLIVTNNPVLLQVLHLIRMGDYGINSYEHRLWDRERGRGRKIGRKREEVGRNGGKTGGMEEEMEEGEEEGREAGGKEGGRGERRVGGNGDRKRKRINFRDSTHSVSINNY